MNPEIKIKKNKLNNLDEISRTLLSATIKASNKVGEETLIRFLNDIVNMMSFKPGFKYQFIENITCQYFDVKTKELYSGNTNSTKAVNCRKMISYMLLSYTDVKDAAVCYLIRINARTLRRYKKQMFDLIELPISDPELHRAYKYLNPIFKTLTE